MSRTTGSSLRGPQTPWFSTQPAEDGLLDKGHEDVKPWAGQRNAGWLRPGGSRVVALAGFGDVRASRGCPCHPRIDHVKGWLAKRRPAHRMPRPEGWGRRCASGGRHAPACAGLRSARAVRRRPRRAGSGQSAVAVREAGKNQDPTRPGHLGEDGLDRAGSGACLACQGDWQHARFRRPTNSRFIQACRIPPTIALASLSAIPECLSRRKGPLLRK